MEREVEYSKNKKNVIYVGNLPRQLTEDQLKTYFNQFGDVLKIRLMKSKKTNRSKGYAFVQFEDHEIAKIAAETMDKYLIDGRSLKVHVKDDEEIVKHLFKRGRTMMIKKNRVKLLNSKLDANKRSLSERLDTLLEAVKSGKKVEKDDETEAFMVKLTTNLEKLKDKQKRFGTDIYDKDIQVYTEALATLNKHFKASD